MRSISDTLTPQELKDLGDLIGHPGWRLLETMIDQEWGAQGFGDKIARTVGAPNMEPLLAVQQLQQATVTQREVQRILKWPREQLLKAKQQSAQPMASMNRGGV